MTVASPQASEQPAAQADQGGQGTEEAIRYAAQLYHDAGIRSDNETLRIIAGDRPVIAAVRDALKTIELEAGA